MPNAAGLMPASMAAASCQHLKGDLFDPLFGKRAN
jgi:hypothetical protein